MEGVATQAAGVTVEVTRLVSPAELENADALPGAVDAQGKVVELGDLGGRISAQGGSTEGSTPSLGLPETGPGLAPVVEAEHALYNPGEFRRNHNRSGTSPEGTFGMLVVGEPHLKGGAQGRDRPGEHYRASGEAGLHHGQVVLVGEGLDFGHVSRVSTVARSELLPGKVLAFAGQARAHLFPGGELLERAARPDEDADSDALIGVWHSGFSGPGTGLPLTPSERYAFLVFGHGSLLSPRGPGR